MTDWQLLRKFTEDNSQAAFAELCRRYTNLVYRVCQRELGETSLAEDAAQAVFLLLARKAPSLKQSLADANLSPWLFQAALMTAKNARRQEQRRQAHELEAAQMQTQHSAGAPEWAKVEPLLNDALQALPSGQRTLIIERYFQDRPLAEIGAGKGISEDAARMRVNRALERLRRWFAAHNIALSAAALAALLPAAVRPAPAHAAEAVARLTLPISGSTPASTLAQGVIDTMNLKRLKLQLGIAALVAVFVLGTAGAVRVTTQMKAKRVAAAQQQNQAQALTVLDQMYATYAAMKSFRCTVTSKEHPYATASEAEYEIQRPDKIRFRRNAETHTALSGQTLAVSDGKNLYVTTTENYGRADRYVKLPFPISAYILGQFGGIGTDGLEPDAGMPNVALGVKRFGDIELLAPQYSLGQPVTLAFSNAPHPVVLNVVVLRIPYRTGAPAPNAKDAVETVTYYIGRNDYLLYHVVVTDVAGSVMVDTQTATIVNEVNPKLNPLDFVFIPPPGSQVVTYTGALYPSG